MTKTLSKLNSVSLDAEVISEFVLDGKKSVFAAIPTNSLLNKFIPNNANTRDYTGLKNKSISRMQTTLKSEPEMFRYKNLGIRIVATDYVRNGNEITLYFDEDEGIFNGGHTAEILQTQGRSSAYVYVLIDIGIPKEQLADISVSLNLSKKIEEISVGEKQGAHEWIKEVLSSEPIMYKEGDSGVYWVDEVLKVSNLLKLGKGRAYSITALKQSLQNKSAIIKENNKNQSLEYTRFILPDFWNLYRRIKRSLVILENLPSKFSKKDEVLQAPALILLSGVRYMTEINHNNIPVWKKDYNPDKALKTCEKLSKSIGNQLSKAPYSEMKSEMICRDINVHNLIQLAFANELNK